MFSILLVFLLTLPSTRDSASEILQKMRKNMDWDRVSYEAEMIIVKGSRRLVKRFQGFGVRDSFFMKFENPEDFGVKYLKRGRELYIYLPDIDDVVRISGDMLKEGMMGSDLSYEDLMRAEFYRSYRAESLAIDSFDGQVFYYVKVVDTTGEAPYYRIELWIDQDNYIPLRIDYYTKSGRRIKRMEVKKVGKVQNRFYPLEFVLRDLRRRDSKTLIRLNKVSFDFQIEKGSFRKEILFR